MNKKAIILISIILILFILIFASFTGLPISSQVEEGMCSVSYKKYLFPRVLCQYVTSGHCGTTNFNEYNAEMEITHCLCDKYLNEPSTSLENMILSRCDLAKPDCDSAIERIKIDFCNDKGFNSFECSEYFRKNSTPKVNFICQNKEQIFYRIFID